MIGVFLWMCLTAVASCYDGYSAVLELMNYRWNSCPENYVQSNSTGPNNDVIGPCPAHYEVIHLARNYVPNYLLNARCTSDCFNKRCSQTGLYKCREVPVKVEVQISQEPIKWKTYIISAGCLCASTVALLAQSNPNVVL